MIQFQQDLFIPLVIFMLSGATGVFAYTLLKVLSEISQEEYKEMHNTCTVLLDWMEWLPTRVISFFYLLLGHFDKGFPIWLKYFTKPASENKEILMELFELNADNSEQGKDDQDNQKTILLILQVHRRMLWASLIMASLMTLMKIIP